MLLMVPVWLLVTWSQAENARQKQRHQIRQILELHVDSLDHTLSRLKAELEQLRAFMNEHDTDSPEVFARSFDVLATGMQADSVWVQAYQIVDDGTLLFRIESY